MFSELVRMWQFMLKFERDFERYNINTHFKMKIELPSWKHNVQTYSRMATATDDILHRNNNRLPFILTYSYIEITPELLFILTNSCTEIRAHLLSILTSSYVDITPELLPIFTLSYTVITTHLLFITSHVEQNVSLPRCSLFLYALCSGKHLGNTTARLLLYRPRNWWWGGQFCQGGNVLFVVIFNISCTNAKQKTFRSKLRVITILDRAVTEWNSSEVQN
jgi:hypothetical protein